MPQCCYSIGLLFTRIDEEGKHQHGQLVWTDAKPNDQFQADTAFAHVIDENDGTAQTLMDDLYAAGLRPAEGKGTAGQLQAVQAHLDTVKTIAFHQLKIPLTK